jgi:hypothetical protein
MNVGVEFMKSLLIATAVFVLGVILWRFFFAPSRDASTGDNWFKKQYLNPDEAFDQVNAAHEAAGQLHAEAATWSEHRIEQEYAVFYLM